MPSDANLNPGQSLKPEDFHLHPMNFEQVETDFHGENADPTHQNEVPSPSMGVERRGFDGRFLDYFGLKEQPFGVTPDLRFLYLGSKHRQALDALNYGTELNRGFLTLIAKPGMGKTSLLFHYLEGLGDNARTVFLFQTDGNSTELMRYLLTDLGLDSKGMDLPEMRALLSQVLMSEKQANRRFVLVIDEAQNLSENVLESIRLLSNFETPWQKLMHIVLAGQPQLADRLAGPSMAQLRQRVSLAIRIEPFTRDEVDLYIDHRLWVAGYKGLSLFSLGARILIAERSEGIPRNINNICFCAMSLAWALKQKTIGREMMRDVLADLDSGLAAEKEILAPKLSGEPKEGVSQTSNPIALTTESTPARGWLSKIGVACLMFFSLARFGIHLNVGKWIESSLHFLSGTSKGWVDQIATLSSPDSHIVVGSDSSSTDEKRLGQSEGNSMNAQQQ
jgi:general secretion pathway protein A